MHSRDTLLAVTALGVPAYQAPDLARPSLKVLLWPYFVFLSPLFEFGQMSMFLTARKSWMRK